MIGSMAITVRTAGAADREFLAQMLAAAASWRPGAPVADVLGQPELAHYVVGWPKPGDRGVIAESGAPVGAAWLRLFSEDDPGYGFVDASTPELSMAVAKRWRGQGIGSTLLRALIAQARADGLAAISLSVEPDNAARRLYERAGFLAVGGLGGSLTMLLRL